MEVTVKTQDGMVYHFQGANRIAAEIDRDEQGHIFGNIHMSNGNWDVNDVLMILLMIAKHMGSTDAVDAAMDVWQRRHEELLLEMDLLKQRDTPGHGVKE